MNETTLRIDTLARTPRLSDTVSDHLLAAIREAHLPPGAKLPSERELGEQFGVSRTVIREAVRHLAAQGVLNTRTGSRVTVAEIDSSNVSGALALFLGRRGPLDPKKIHEVRETIETRVVRLAAERATDDDLAEIRELHERFRIAASDPEAASKADVGFHRAIAKAAANELFLILLDSISDTLMEIRRATLGQRGRPKIVTTQHARILEALERRDPETAVTAMEHHLIDSFKTYRRATKQ